MNALPAAVPTSRRSAGAVLVACAVGFVVGEFVATALVALGVALAHYPGGLTALANAAQPPWWANALSLAGLWVGFGGAIVYAGRPGRLAPLDEAWRIRPGDALYVLVGVACQGAVSVLYAPFHPKGLSTPVHHLFDSSHGATLVALGVMSVAAAPLLEEWFFRGVVFRALRQALGSRPGALSTGAAALVSAVLFALAHGEPLQFAGLALLGVVLALLVERTGRLVPSVVAHASFNAVAFTVLLVQRSR
ncbi:MAG: CPBP family intramembrane glutamic endopeptidase [Acidimicrobiales bacterium]